MKLELNLLPVEQKTKGKSGFFYRNFWILLLLGNLLALGIIYLGLYYLNQGAMNKIAILEQEIEIKKAKELPYESLEEQSKGLIFREILLAELEKNQGFSLRELNALKDSIPQGTKILNYQYENNKILLICQSENQDEIIEMRNSLVDCQIFSKVGIEHILKKKVEEPALVEPTLLDDEKNKVLKEYWVFNIGLNI